MPFLQGLHLADPEFGRSERVDSLLGVTHCNHCTWDEVKSSPDTNLTAWKTIFCWAIGGSVSRSSWVNVCLKASSTDARADELLQKFWAIEEVPGEKVQWTKEERQAAEQFQDTSSREEDGQYVVRLPRKPSPGEIGESRSRTLKHYLQNERSLQWKGRGTELEEAIQEYGWLGHAELVPPNAPSKNPNAMFYFLCTVCLSNLALPRSTSDKSSTGISLNDTLLSGP